MLDFMPSKDDNKWNFIFVVGVSILMFYVYANWWILVALPWKSFETITGILHICIFNLFVFMTIYNYSICVRSSPGDVPRGWFPENATTEEIEHAKKQPASPHDVSPVVWCSRCENCKPKRAHHCRICNRCRLKMDHHCPWINNCVGHNNHKYFFLFLLYASVGLIDACGGFLWRITEVFSEFVDDPVPFVLLMFNICFVLPVALGMMVLLHHQIGVLTSNTTTIEDSVRKWQEHDAKKAENYNYRWEYDVGTMANVKQVLGPNIALWLIPTPPMNDGLVWPTTEHSRILSV